MLREATRHVLYIAGNPALAQLSGITGTTAYGNKRYDALQSTLRKRFGRGFEYQLSYTWSKGMSDFRGYYGEGGQAVAVQPQNTYNRRTEWGPSYFDAGQMFATNGAYELPIGRGMAVGSQWSRALEALAGGWRLSGVLSLRSGFRLTVTALDRSGTVSIGARAETSSRIQAGRAASGRTRPGSITRPFDSPGPARSDRKALASSAAPASRTWICRFRNPSASPNPSGSSFESRPLTSPIRRLLTCLT